MRVVSNTHPEVRELLAFTERYHSLFRAFIEVGQIVFTDRIPTACVTFDKEGRHVSFLWNEEWWNGLDTYNRAFVMCHELIHIVYQHGIRLDKSYPPEINNIAADLVDNAMLIEKFGFEREKIENWQKYCWFDTVKFNKDNVPQDREFEYYLPIIAADQGGEGNKGDQGQSGESGGVVTVESEHGEGFEEITIEELKEVLGDEFEDLEKEINSLKAGVDAGGQCRKVDISGVKKLDVWEKVVQKWTVMGRCDYEMALNTRWDRRPRRFEGILSDNSKICVPCEVMDETKVAPSKIRLALFMDTSGSCTSFAEHFFKAAASLSKRFIVDLYCFDTKVYPTTLESKKLYGFGGTAFDIIENYIQKNMTKYPDAVWVLTDGYGNSVQAEKPERWHWFMLKNHTTSYVEKGSKIHKLADFYNE